MAKPSQELPRIAPAAGDGTPIYLQITQSLKEAMRNGALPPDAGLPPERVVCRHYGVSRMTLRQAYSLLERDGYIERQRGRGTFVAPNRVRKQQQEMRSFTEEIAVRGGVASSQLLSFRRREPDAAAKAFFSIAAGALVYEIERVRFSNGVPLALEKVAIPCSLCSNLERFNLSSQSLYRILEQEYGLKLSHCTEEISAARPSRAHRKLLRVRQSGALLVIQRMSYTVDHRAVELATTVYRGDLYTAIVRSIRGR